MSVLYQQGQELDENDLRVFFRDSQGNALTSLEVRYSIYYLDGTAWVSLGDSLYRQTPETSSTAGKYWADWTIPAAQTTGCYQIRWDFRESSSSQWKQKSINFAIVKYQTTSPVRTAELSDLADEPVVIVR